MVKLFILDPDLVSFGGHNFNYLEGLVAAARQRGIETTVWGHRSIDPTVARSIGAIGHFTTFGRSVLMDAGTDVTTRTAWTQVVLNAVYGRDLERLTSRLTPDTIVFLPTATSRQLFALAQWLALIAPPSLPKVVCVLRYDLEAYPEEAALLSVPARVLTSLKRPAVLYCETESNAAMHRDALGVPVSTLAFPFRAESSYRSPNTPPVIGYFGDGRHMKGFHLMPELTARDAPWQLLIQTFDAGDDTDAKRHLANLRRVAALKPDVVTLVDRAVDRTTYLRLMRSCDIVLLPYLASAYRRASSAVFCEALSAARVVVVPDETWMSDTLRSLGAVPAVFQDWTADSIRCALEGAVGELPHRSKEAEALAATWNRTNGPSIVLDQLRS